MSAVILWVCAAAIFGIIAGCVGAAIVFTVRRWRAMRRWSKRQSLSRTVNKEAGNEHA